MSIRTSIIISFWLLAFTALICVCERGSRAAGPFYVSTTATNGGDGSIGNPWKLTTVCAGDPGFGNPNPPAALVAASSSGANMYLRGGMYLYPATPNIHVGGCYFNGSAGNPIKMMPYPGEKAIIDRNWSESSVATWSSGTTYANGDYARYTNAANIAASPTGATESGTTVTITTTTPQGFTAGERVVISGVGVAGYNGTFTITGTPSSTTFTYTDGSSGLGTSGSGTAVGTTRNWQSLQNGNLNHAPVEGAFWTAFGLADWEAPLLLGGNYIWAMGLEVTNTNTDRTVARPEGVVLKGIGTAAINLVIHDNCDGIWPESTALGAIVYGNLVFNNGTTENAGAGEDGTCHGMYMQNSDASQPKLITDNISFTNYGFGYQMYSGNSNVLRGFTFSNDTSFNQGAPVGTFHNAMILGGNSSPANVYALIVDSCYIYNGALQVGDSSGTSNNDAVVTNNEISKGELAIYRPWASMTVSGNTVVASGVNSGFVHVLFDNGGTFLPYSWNNNHYYGNTTLPMIIDDTTPPCAPGACGFKSLAAWTSATGFDAASTYANGSLPANAIHLRANTYDSTRSHIIINNYTDASTVSVDVSSRLSNGDTYQLFNVQNLTTPVLSGTYSGSNLSVPMTGVSVVQPYGGAVTVNASGPRFGAFLLIKTTSAPSAFQSGVSGKVTVSGSVTIR